MSTSVARQLHRSQRGRHRGGPERRRRRTVWAKRRTRLSGGHPGRSQSHQRWQRRRPRRPGRGRPLRSRQPDRDRRHRHRSILDPPDDGIVVDSAELASPALEAEIAGNVIRMEGGDRDRSSRGKGAWILGNRIFGSQTGIKTVEPIAYYGNVVDRNLIEGPAVNGILIENNFNEIVGNEVLGAGGAGIWIQGATVFGSDSGTLVGGDAQRRRKRHRRQRRRRDRDLQQRKDRQRSRSQPRNRQRRPLHRSGCRLPATEVGPNRGIKPPTFSTSTQTGASGGAKAKARRCESFASRSPRPGSSSRSRRSGRRRKRQLDVTYDERFPAGTIVAATQTVEGATSELATTGSGIEGSAGSAIGVLRGWGEAQFAGSAAPIRPRTKIVKGRLRHHSARFVFEASQSGSIFLCRLDDKPFDHLQIAEEVRGLGGRQARLLGTRDRPVRACRPEPGEEEIFDLQVSMRPWPEIGRTAPTRRCFVVLLAPSGAGAEQVVNGGFESGR